MLHTENKFDKFSKIEGFFGKQLLYHNAKRLSVSFYIVVIFKIDVAKLRFTH